MDPSLQQKLDSIIDQWQPNIRGRTLQIGCQDASSSDCSDIISHVASLRSYFRGENLIINTTHENGAFEYRILWENGGHITSTPQSDSDLSLERIFGTNTEAISAFEKVQENFISSQSELDSSLAILCSCDEVHVSFSYTILGEDLDEYISEEIDSDANVSYYFSPESIKTKMSEVTLEDVKDFTYSQSHKRLFVVRGLSDHFYGQSVGFFPPSDLNNSSSLMDFLKRSTAFEEQLAEIRRQCAIDYFDEIYVPPSYFEIDNNTDGDLSRYFQQTFLPFQLMFCILGVSNIARREGSSWKLRVNGRRVIESTIGLEEQRDGLRLKESDEDERTGYARIDPDTVNHFRELFEWIYSARTEDRIIVFRNIVTIYTTSVVEMVEEADEITKGVKSNFKFYIKDSVEEFVGVQQDVSSYLFELQREISDLRRGLANNLNKDLFRVFGFTAVTWVAVISGLSKIANINLALALSLIPVCIYLILGIRGTYGLSQQLKSIENSRDRYYSMYESRIDDRVLADIKKADSSGEVRRQFKIDLWIYYILFGFLALAGGLTILDLLIWHEVVTEMVNSLVNNPTGSGAVQSGQAFVGLVSAALKVE